MKQKVIYSKGDIINWYGRPCKITAVRMEKRAHSAKAGVYYTLFDGSRSIPTVSGKTIQAQQQGELFAQKAEPVKVIEQTNDTANRLKDFIRDTYRPEPADIADRDHNMALNMMAETVLGERIVVQNVVNFEKIK